MYCITEQQVDFILSDIRRRGVEMEDLQSNLLDHICCMVEQNLKEGEDFEAFYQRTIPTFFKRELWEIEEETITLLTFKHYYAMKKIMMTTGAISVVSLLFGSFFKIMHWPGSGPLLVVGIATLSFVFLPLLFVLKARESNTVRDKIVGATGTIVGILLCLATLFKIMHWPGASMLWILTSASSIFLFIPLYFFTGIRKPETKMNTIVTTIILVGATGLLFSLTNVRPSRFFETSSVNSDLKAVFLADELKDANLIACKKLLRDSSFKLHKELSRFHKKSSNLYDHIDSLKEQISAGYSSPFKFSWQNNGRKWKTYAVSDDWENAGHILFDEETNAVPIFRGINDKLDDFDNRDKINGFEISWDKEAKSAKLAGIKAKMLELADIANKEFHCDFTPVIVQEIFSIPNSTGKSSWEMMNFYHASQAVVMRNLTQIQMNICVMESNILMQQN